MKTTNTGQTFFPGDLVQSDPTCPGMGLAGTTDLWIAQVVEVKRWEGDIEDSPPDGCCYVTKGRWTSEPPTAPLTRLQLWSDSLLPR